MSTADAQSDPRNTNPQPEVEVKMRSRFLPLFLVSTLTAAPALAAYSPTVPPPGWTAGADAWAKQFTRSDAASKVAAKLVRGASAECIRAVFLKIWLRTRTVAGLDGTLTKADAKSLNANAAKEQDSSCNGPSNGNPGSTVQAVVEYMEDGSGLLDGGAMREAVAESYRYARPVAKPGTPWVEYLLKAGVLVQGGAERAASGAAALVPILNPERFGKQKYNAQDGI